MTLSNKSKALLTRITSSTSPEEGRAIVDEILQKDNVTAGTYSSNHSLVKSHLVEKGIDWRRYMEKPYEVNRQLKKERTRYLEDKENIHIDRTWVDVILKWENSCNIHELCAFLQLTSGRRISEICESYIVKYNENLGSCELKKKRGDCSMFEFPAYNIDVDEWIDIYTDVQEDINLFDYKTSTITRGVNRRLKGVHPCLSSHKLRGMYANLVWQASGRKMNQSGYIQKVLCLKDQNVALHYCAYII